MRSAMSEATTPRAPSCFATSASRSTRRRCAAPTSSTDARFVETVEFEGVETLDTPAVRSVAELWFVLAGLSYYKTGAARRIDVGSTPLGAAGRRLLVAALRDGLGEFSYRNDLPLDDVTIAGGDSVAEAPITLDPHRVLVPFGGGIDSVVTVESLSSDLETSLFIVSPSTGRFAPLEATAAKTGLPVVRATRHLDSQLLSGEDSFFHGHVPVTAMITLLCAMAAVASGRGGVVMSNEHSASIPNLEWSGRRGQSPMEQVPRRRSPHRRRAGRAAGRTTRRGELPTRRAARSGSPRSSVNSPRTITSFAAVIERFARVWISATARGAVCATSVCSSTWCWRRTCRGPRCERSSATNP